MADRVVFVTPDEFGEHFLPRQMVKDLLGVAAIASDRIGQLAEALQAEDGFLTEERLGKIVAEHINDEAQASAAASVIQNLRPAILDQTLAMVGAWRESSRANAERFPDDTFAALRQKLPSLVKEYPALSRMRKASRLRGVLGNELEEVEFICDARPVFDRDRERIEGLLALTTMKLLYERQNGVSDELEILITSEQLDDLISKAQKAQQKLGILTASFERWVDDSAD